MSPFRRVRTLLQDFLANETAGGLVLMTVAVAAVIVANSPLAAIYFDTLHAYVGPLSVHAWIADGLMAIFFLLVGLEIKREVVEGELSTWASRVLPGTCAAAGMAVPALVYLAVNGGDPATQTGWAIPAATDIAFALAILSMVSVPQALKVFLVALAIIDDLGAVLIIALFYSHGLSVPFLMGAAAVVTVLVAMNLLGVKTLWPYLALGAILWWLVLQSGVHATLAGVVLALTIPARPKASQPDDSAPLHTLEHVLHKPVAFLVVPVFGFASAGLSFTGMSPAALLEPVALGVMLGLLLGKTVGVFGAAFLLIKSKLAPMPANVSWRQLLGLSVLCGVGFTMSMFIEGLAFADASLQSSAKLGILAGSLLAGLIGYAILATARPRPAGTAASG